MVSYSQLSFVPPTSGGQDVLEYRVQAESNHPDRLEAELQLPFVRAFSA